MIVGLKGRYHANLVRSLAVLTVFNSQLLGCWRRKVNSATPGRNLAYVEIVAHMVILPGKALLYLRKEYDGFEVQISSVDQELK